MEKQKHRGTRELWYNIRSVNIRLGVNRPKPGEKRRGSSAKQFVHMKHRNEMEHNQSQNSAIHTFHTFHFIDYMHAKSGNASSCEFSCFPVFCEL